MKAKGVIRKLVKWAESRTYFYWRLRRRLIEFELFNSLEHKAQDSAAQRKQFLQQLQVFYQSKASGTVNWDDDEHVFHWLQDNLQHVKAFVWKLKSQQQVSNISEKLKALLASAPTTENSNVSDLLKDAMQSLSAQDKAVLVAALQS